MGRRKITISQIVDPKLRHITFNKRKNGLIKKAAELSLLCNVNMLLIFEDGNGNLIQFSKNKLANIPAFFQECRYSNVLEFIARDYPNFFKVNHYKKYREQHPQDDYDQDDLDMGDEDDMGAPSLDLSPETEKPQSKKEKIHNQTRSRDEERDRMIYQSDEESDSETTKNSGNSSNYEQVPLNPRKKLHVEVMKPRIAIQEKPKNIAPEQNEIEENFGERETIIMNKNESFQSYKEVQTRVRVEKNIDYASQMAGFEHAYKRNNQPLEQGNPHFNRYFPNNDNINGPNPVQNNYNNNNQNYNNGYPHYVHMGPGYLNGPINNPKSNRMNPYGMPNEENFIMKPFPQMSFGPGPYLSKHSSRNEPDEKMYETANMIKYLNGNNGNAFPGTKMHYNYPPENGKYEEPENTPQFRSRNEYEAYPSNFEQEYPENGPMYVRGELNKYEPSNMAVNLPNNLPSAYFSSKKFNFVEGNVNYNGEERLNEYGDQKRKFKQY